MATWVNGGSATVKKDSSKKHYYHGNSVNCSAVTNDMINATGRIFAYFSPGGSTFQIGSSGSQGQGVSNNEHISQTIPLTLGQVSVYVYVSTYQNPACRSVSATLTYGSKAQPTGYCSFSGGYVNPFSSKTFTFGVNYIENIDEQYTISGGTFYWKDKTESTWNGMALSNRSATIASGSLVSGHNYEYYGRLVLDDGTTINTPTYSFDTVDGTPSCKALTPNNAVIYGSTGFTWSYSNSKSTPQYAYDIQVSHDSGSTWSTIYNHIVTKDTTAPVYDGFTAGEWLWRVRTYNNDNVASAWSDPALFISNVAPDAPVITSIETTDKVHIQWVSYSQAAFHVVIEDMATKKVVHDSGEVYSSATDYLVNDYLPNGNYLAKVKIINVYGKQSPYGDKEFTISAQSLVPEVVAQYIKDEDGIRINIVNADEFDHYYLKRDGELIASFSGDTYIDKFVSGKEDYTLIAIADNAYGIVSFSAVAEIPSARIITLDGKVYNVDQRWDKMFVVSSQETRKGTVVEYLGAKTPEHIFGSIRSKVYNFAFYDPDRIGSKLLGQTVYYADQYGSGDWCAVVSTSRADEWFGDDTALELERTLNPEIITF